MFGMMLAATDDVLAAAPVWLSNLWNIAQMILGFSVIVFVHELGHFAAAKWAGVKVEQFAIGFGKELFGFTKGETRYSFKLLPLGGYVKMLGQEDFVVDKSGELKVKPDPRSFTNKSVAKRMVIVCAGVVMNLIFAAVAFTIVAMVGRMRPPAVVGYVVETMPAGLAGLKPGDRIIEINGEEVRDFDQLMERVSLSGGGEVIELVVKRNGKVIPEPFRIVPEYQEDVHRRQIGVSPGFNTRVAGMFSPAGMEPGPNDLQTDDQITHVVLNGERRELAADFGALNRAISASGGQPLELIVKRPQNPDQLTAEMVHAFDDDGKVDATEVTVRTNPLWYPAPYDVSTPNYASILGFVPRLSVFGLPEEDGVFQKAGVQLLDVITKFDTIDNPSFPQAVECFNNNAGKTVDLFVRRPFEANKGFSKGAVQFLTRQRESLMMAAIQDFTQFGAVLDKLVSEASLEDADRATIAEKIGGIDDIDKLRNALETVDIHQLEVKIPDASLVKNTSLGQEITLLSLSENDIVIADVIEKFGNRPTMAGQSEIPLYARILKVNDDMIRGWNSLANAFKTHAGNKIALTYRVLNEIRTTRVTVPDCVQAEFNLLAGDRIVEIAGKSSIEVTIGQDNQQRKVTYQLPDRRAIEALLAAHVGETVDVKFVRYDGGRGSGEYAVTESNIDPWLERIGYSQSFMCYSLAERNPISNPLTAFLAGSERAYNATVSTVRTIQRLITRDIGTRNMSGPLGIIAIGSQVADKSVLDLIWLLGFLSANLAVINFLPLPIVDGGLFLFLVLEKIRGEPVSIRVQMATQMIGIALIMTIFILVTAQDIYKLFL